MMCAYCGNPLDREGGSPDEQFCKTKEGIMQRCKFHNKYTPEDERATSDGVCEDCVRKGIPFKEENEFPYNINKGNTPKDELLRDISSKSGKEFLTQEQINEKIKEQNRKNNEKLSKTLARLLK